MRSNPLSPGLPVIVIVIAINWWWHSTLSARFAWSWENPLGGKILCSQSRWYDDDLSADDDHRDYDHDDDHGVNHDDVGDFEDDHVWRDEGDTQDHQDEERLFWLRIITFRIGQEKGESNQLHPGKCYNVLGTNKLIEKMKVDGLSRKRNYSGRYTFASYSYLNLYSPLLYFISFLFMQWKYM